MMDLPEALLPGRLPRMPNVAHEESRDGPIVATHSRIRKFDGHSRLPSGARINCVVGSYLVLG